MSGGAASSALLGHLGLFTVLLILGATISVVFVFTALMPTRVGLMVGCYVNTFQLYTFPISTFYPSLGMLSWLSTWRASLYSGGLWRWKWMQALVLLMMAQVISLAWSPDKVTGIRDLLYSLPMILAAHAAYRLALDDPKLIQKCVNALFVSTVVEAFLVIVFRASPGIEGAFLHSHVARIFISGNVLDVLFTPEGANNVLDPDKAGGFFVNGNIASVFLGMSALGAWYFGRYNNLRLLYYVAIFDWCAVFFTGSKAAAVIALILPVVMAGFGVLRSRRISPAGFIFAALTVGFGSVGSVLIYEFLDRFNAKSQASLRTHKLVWHFARIMFQEHPLRGLGFGGWELKYPLYAYTYGVAPGYPPHNSLLMIWSQSGMLGLLTGLLWIGCVFAALSRGIRMGRQEGMFAIGIGGVFAWYLFEGFGENMGLAGEVHMTPIIAVLLGYLCARCDLREPLYERASEPVRGHRPPSAIPDF